MSVKYHLELAPAAKRDFKSLFPAIQEEIVLFHLPSIENNPYQEGRPLSGVLHGERSYNFGHHPEYRIIYFIDKNTIIITLIGSRESIYKKAKRRK
jgi:mRNA-degrading endonuclease RelE of RelBE toxin-antitoxin system